MIPVLKTSVRNPGLAWPAQWRQTQKSMVILGYRANETQKKKKSGRNIKQRKQTALSRHFSNTEEMARNSLSGSWKTVREEMTQDRPRGVPQVRAIRQSKQAE